MQATTPVPLWAGRTLAIVGIAIVALTLRLAVAAISPIIDQVRVDIPMSSTGVGLLGALPPILFAAAGFVAPPISRRLGLERSLILAIVLMFVGHLGRAFAPEFASLVAGSVVVLLGIGLGNVLLPPIVRRYFPDRMGIITAIYVCALSVSSAIPAIVAAPLADGVGWRFSLGIWAGTAVIAVVPWLMLVGRERRAAAVVEEEVVEEPKARLVGKLWRSRVALSITLAFSVSTLGTYASFAWLPEILTDVAGADHTQAGLYLALFGIIGAPGAVVAPLLVTRIRNPGWIILFGVVCYVIGYVGLLVLPGTATVLWVIALGCGPILFPVCLGLISTRTRSHEGTVALSGFAQGIAYTLGALGPLVVGIVHDATNSWTIPIVVLLAVALCALIPALTLGKPTVMEDELDAHPRAAGRVGSRS